MKPLMTFIRILGAVKKKGSTRKIRKSIPLRSDLLYNTDRDSQFKLILN